MIASINIKVVNFRASKEKDIELHKNLASVFQPVWNFFKIYISLDTHLKISQKSNFKDYI